MCIPRYAKLLMSHDLTQQQVVLDEYCMAAAQTYSFFRGIGINQSFKLRQTKHQQGADAASIQSQKGKGGQALAIFYGTGYGQVGRLQHVATVTLTCCTESKGWLIAQSLPHSQERHGASSMPMVTFVLLLAIRCFAAKPGYCTL